MKQNLRALEICYYVYGGLLCLGGFVPLIYVAVGSFFSSGAFLQHADSDLVAFLGPIMIVMGTFIFLFIEAWGILNIVSGRMIANRKGRTFSFVVGGLNCLSIPLGLALGVFTFVLLSNAEVQEEYMNNRELLTDRAH